MVVLKDTRAVIIDKNLPIWLGSSGFGHSDKFNQLDFRVKGVRLSWNHIGIKACLIQLEEKKAEWMKQKRWSTA